MERPHTGEYTHYYPYHTDDDDRQCKGECCCSCQMKPEECQTHVHEIQGSVQLAECGKDRHNHRFSTVSGQVIPCGNSHRHAFLVNTDFYDHLHQVVGETGLAIMIGNGKHVHFAQGKTSMNDGHHHKYEFSTLIDSPILPNPEKCK